MKDKEKRNKKGSESTIGKIIYGFLLFMPLFAIGVTCGYAMFNKNAYISFSKSNETANVSSLNLSVNQSYLYEYTGITEGETNNTTNLIKIGEFPYELRDNTVYIRFVNSGRVYEYDNSQTLIGSSLEIESAIYTVLENVSLANQPWFKNYVITSKQSQLSDSFYYAVDKVTESPLFNWAENSIIYTTTNATCNALSITTPFIPLLLSYWLIISVMYFLYDIALMLIWVLHDRIHALKDSIT